MATTETKDLALRDLLTVDRIGAYGVSSVPSYEQRAMPAFAFWYAVFLLGGAVGATAGSSFDNGLALIGGLLGGMALSGLVAGELASKRLFLPHSEKSDIQPAQVPQALPKGLDRVRFASSHPGITAAPDTFGPLWLPKG